MGLHHRNLISNLCQNSCYEEGPCSSEIEPDDCNDCLKTCSSVKYYYPPLPSPPIDPDKTLSHSKNNNISTYLIIGFSIVATAFFLLICYAIYAKFFSNRNRSRRRVLSSRQQTDDDDFVDEEHGPVVDHPIWYIRTTGLHQSIIDAIMVCKYKKGEGLIEGTECSVCLGEFEEDESLRLLPKCNHAFHLPCIDTWLRSHTNCPMCRAPIVTNPARIPSMEHRVVDSTSLESGQVESLENSGDGGSGVENGADESRNVEEEEGLVVEVEDGRRVFEIEDSDSRVGYIQPRRSVSLDSSSAAKINLSLSNVLPVESHGNTERQQIGEVNGLIVSKRIHENENLVSGAKGSSSFNRTRYLQSATSSMKRSRSFNGKHLLSFYNRSQKKPNGILRSF